MTYLPLVLSVYINPSFSNSAKALWTVLGFTLNVLANSLTDGNLSPDLNVRKKIFEDIIYQVLYRRLPNEKEVILDYIVDKYK